MSVCIPLWLTKDFIKFALLEGKESNILIEKMDVERAVPKGNNYSSMIYRVNVEYKALDNEVLHKTSLIIKSLTDTAEELIKSAGLADKEFRVYNEILPKVNELLGENLGPKVYPSSVKDILIMEDLKLNGFSLADRVKQLDYWECAVALSALAKFHAATSKIYDSDPELIREIGKEGLFSDNKEAKLMLMGFHNAAMNEVLTWPELGRIHNAIRNISETIFEEISAMIKPKEGAFNVMNHGDTWSSNMLFKYNNGKAVEVKLVDYQIARYTSPAFDIMDFKSVAMQEDIKDNKFQELLDIYLEVLNSTLEKLGSDKRFLQSELNEDLERYKLFELLFSIFGLGMILCDPSNVIDFTDVSIEDMKADIHPFSFLFKTETFKKRVSKRLLEFEQSGLFRKFLGSNTE